MIKEMATESDCVIVGRYAIHILKAYKPLHIFVYVDIDYKMKRCREIEPIGENLSDKELRQKISSVDKKRYRFYTSNAWGDRLNCDLCINMTNATLKNMFSGITKPF